MKCSKCNKKATYNHPKAFCSFHWAKWWCHGYKRDWLIQVIADNNDEIDKLSNTIVILKSKVKNKVK